MPCWFYLDCRSWLEFQTCHKTLKEAAGVTGELRHRTLFYASGPANYCSQNSPSKTQHNIKRHRAVLCDTDFSHLLCCAQGHCQSKTSLNVKLLNDLNFCSQTWYDDAWSSWARLWPKCEFFYLQGQGYSDDSKLHWKWMFASWLCSVPLTSLQQATKLDVLMYYL